MNCLVSFHMEEEEEGETLSCGTQKARLGSKGGSDRRPGRDSTPGKPARHRRALTAAWGLGFLA